MQLGRTTSVPPARRCTTNETSLSFYLYRVSLHKRDEVERWERILLLMVLNERR